MEIYLLRNKANDKYYVGKTSRSSTIRLEEHLSWVKTGHLPIYKAMRKYDIQAFELQVLSTAQTLLELDNLERLWIRLLNSCDTAIGYNLALGGNGGRIPKIVGVPRTLEVKERISKKQLGKKVSQETRSKQSTSAFKHRAKLSASEKQQMVEKAHKASPFQCGNTEFARAMAMRRWRKRVPIRRVTLSSVPKSSSTSNK